MARPKVYASAKEKQRAYRARLAASRVHRLDARPPVVAVVDHSDPVGALAEWSRTTLIVPPGHPRSGKPLELMPFAVSWLRETWDAHESALSTARKNSKSAIAAVLALGYLVGPLRRPGWRGVIASLSLEKANELRRQVKEISEASSLDIRIRRSPYPGTIESATGSLDTLSADRSAGHSSGYDLIVIDESGLLPERARDLLAGLRSSVSARDGRIRHISVRGDSPLFREVLDNPAVPSHIYSAPNECEINDESAWSAANPALGVVKSIAYMRSEVLRVRGVPSDEPSFRALDLNLEISPTREMVCTPDDLRACFADEVAFRGPCYLGIDVGEAGSGTAACAFFPATGALRTWLAYGSVPTLKARAKRDNADYAAMQARGELRTYAGRTTPVKAFIADVYSDLGGADVRLAVADAYKAEALRDALPWKLLIQRTGSGPDGSASVRAFQRRILAGELSLTSNLSLASAIKESTLRRDANGNPAVDRARSHGRNDVLAAAILAVGVGDKLYRPGRRALRSAIA